MKNIPSVFATLVPLRRGLISALLVLGLTLGSVALTATPVEAASMVVACFQRTGPTYWVRDRLNVHLKAWNGVSWEQIGLTQQIDETGCTTFLVPPGHQDKWLWTELVDVGTGGRFYTGSPDISYFFWPNGSGGGGWYPMTVFGSEYIPWNHLVWPHTSFPVEIWAQIGTYQCQVSYPVPLTPC